MNVSVTEKVKVRERERVRECEYECARERLYV